MSRKSRLVEDIRLFRKKKPILAVVFIILGLSGLILPILPGWLLLIFGIILLFPSFEDRLKDKFEKVRRDFRS
ncbi:hypothetical protein GF407_06605 [candidate division KSB1 bacterium]|nr:hypothetical protein [candidate division KSB1 bacterium]